MAVEGSIQSHQLETLGFVNTHSQDIKIFSYYLFWEKNVNFKMRILFSDDIEVVVYFCYD